MSVGRIGERATGPFLVALCMAFYAVAADASPSTIDVDDACIMWLGFTATVSITLDQAPAGLSGYTMTVSLSNTAIAEITDVEFPNWAPLTDHSALPADSFWMRAVDLNEEIEAGATNIDLGTLTIRGDAEGTCAITVAVSRMDDDSGNPLNPSVRPGTAVVGGTAAVFRVDGSGNVAADRCFFAQSFRIGSADVAEWVCVSEPVESGDVLELDPRNPGCYRKACEASSYRVAGVVATQPGVVLGGYTTGPRALLALMGIVPVRACDEGGPIEPGDLLVSASIPGHVMRWDPGTDSRSATLVGKALERLNGGSALILALLAN